MVIAIIVAILAIIIGLACYGVYVVVHKSDKEKEKEEASKIAVSGKYAAALRPVAEALAEKKPSKAEIEEWLDSQGVSEEQKNKYLDAWQKSIDKTIKTINEGDASGVTAYRVEVGECDKDICNFLPADNYITRNQISKNAEILPPYCLGSDSIIVPKHPWEKSDSTGGWKAVVPNSEGDYSLPDWRRFCVITFAIFASLLSSCASSKPGEQAAPPAAPAAPVSTTVIVKERIVDTLKIRDSIFVKETQSFKTLQKSIDSLIAIRETERAIDLLKQQVQYHNNLDQLGFRTLQLANLLYHEGHSAEALAILESFAVYKPSINFWIDSANTLYDKIIKMSREGAMQQIDPIKLQNINSLTAQIRNLKNTNANPALITVLADSLRAMAPGDSVLHWLEKQIPPEKDNSDAFCEEQRKFAAENFATSRKNKAKANALLNEAIEALDKCLAKTPSADMRKKVMQNREVLTKELGN